MPATGNGQNEKKVEMTACKKQMKRVYLSAHMVKWREENDHGYWTCLFPVSFQNRHWFTFKINTYYLLQLQAGSQNSCEIFNHNKNHQ